MTGLVFYRTANRERTVRFYVERLDADRWLEQPGGCTILALDNLLVGFCDAAETESEGILTLAVADRAAVDDHHDRLSDVAEGPPTASEAFDIYHFFLTDPDGRTVEVQSFDHETPPTPGDG